MSDLTSKNNEKKKIKSQNIAIFSLLIVIIFALLSWFLFHNSNKDDFETQNNHSDFIKSVDSASAEESIDEPDPEDNVVRDDSDDANDSNDAENDLTKYIVKKGDTFEKILQQYGINNSDIYSLINQYKQRFKNLKLGQNLSWKTDENHNLVLFNWMVSDNDVWIYVKTGNIYTESHEVKKGIWKPTTIKGEITSNFSSDAQIAGLTGKESIMVKNALQWQLDFKKLQKGDLFAVVLSREMFDNSHGQSKLEGVHIKNGSRDYYAILAHDGSYYDNTGGSISKGFFRYPLANKARVSSKFNPRRLNPVTKRITAHNGVDFAVSRGTPVLSVGDGDVLIAKYSGSAGNFITIRHSRQYTTRYMHLDKLLVKQGQHVKKGDRIGLSGNTGRSTGAHLHFELHVDGKPVDPLTASLPVAERLTGKEKTQLLARFNEIKGELDLSSINKASETDSTQHSYSTENQNTTPKTDDIVNGEVDGISKLLQSKLGDAQ